MAQIKNVAIQMDHVSTISIDGDTTFALSLEAQSRGYNLFHYTPDRLSQRDGKVYASMEAMTLRDVEGDHFTLGERKRIPLEDMDVVLLRQDPPFDMFYITTTHLSQTGTLLGNFHRLQSNFPNMPPPRDLRERISTGMKRIVTEWNTFHMTRSDIRDAGTEALSLIDPL